MLAALAHMNDFNASVNRTVDNDVARVGYGKTAVLEAKFRAGTSHVRIICKAIDKAECIGRAALSNIVVNLL